MSQPDLFVVCRNCGSEVSPYVTECPYCGQRVRRRAPKIERQGEEEPPRRRRRRLPRMPRGGASEIEGVAPDSRPVATLGLVGLSLVATLAVATGAVGLLGLGGILMPVDDDPWRYVTAPFVHDNFGYQFAALLTVAIFGTLLERRFGPIAPVAIFLLAGAGGAAAAVAVDLAPPFQDVQIGYWVLGANGAGLGLLLAWLVEDRLAARRGLDRGNDLIGVLVLAAVLALMPLAVAEASAVAGVAGAAVGAVLGLLLAMLGRR